MNKIVIGLLVLVSALLVAHVVVLWRADQHAQQEAARQSCLERVEATAMIALLAPQSEVDTQGRLRAMSALGSRVDDC